MLLKSFIFPTRCILCRSAHQHYANFCAACLQDLPSLPQNCQQCAQFLPVSASAMLLCGECMTEPPAFDRVYALFPYTTPIVELVVQLKFQHALQNAQAFGELLAQRVQHVWYRDQSLPDLIVPVPLHATRLRERGFNQAVEIARPIAKACKLPLEKHAVKRRKATQAQTRLSAAARQRNVAGAFMVERDCTGLTIAVVDDVVTTTATVRALSQALQAKGAQRIDIWCCARRG